MFKRFKVWMRVMFGMKFIRCERADDILVIKRFGDQAEWQYTLEMVAQIVASCGHPHNIVFGDAEFVIKDARQYRNRQIEESRND